MCNLKIETCPFHWATQIHESGSDWWSGSSRRVSRTSAGALGSGQYNNKYSVLFFLALPAHLEQMILPMFVRQCAVWEYKSHPPQIQEFEGTDWWCVVSSYSISVFESLLTMWQLSHWGMSAHIWRPVSVVWGMNGPFWGSEKNILVTTQLLLWLDLSKCKYWENV